MNNYTSKKRKRTCVIYLIQINGKSYVGQTTAFRSRKRDHLSALRRNKHHNIHLQRAFNKHGAKSLKWTKLEHCFEHELDERERHWIKFFNSYHNGFNQNEGGEHTYGHACTWNGVNYPSLSAAAEAIGCSTTTMQRRLASGWTCDSEVHDKGESARISVVWNGINYRSITECAESNGMSTNSMSAKLKQGYVCDGDVPEHAEWSRKSVEWNGVVYPSRAECSRKTGMPTTTLNQYIKRGYLCDNDIPVSRVKLDFEKAKEIRQIYATGNWSYKKLANKYGVSIATIQLTIQNKIWQCSDD